MIAEGLGVGASPIQPGRILLGEIYSTIAAGNSCIFETTLSGKTWAALIKKAQHAGYICRLHYLFLPKVETAIERVAFRVSNGGHFIPEETIRRRYERSRKQFVKCYQHLFDSWFLYNNRQFSAQIIAYRSGNSTGRTFGLDSLFFKEHFSNDR